MGQCIYVTTGLQYKDRDGPSVRTMRSETWMDPAEAGRILAEGAFLNTTAGVWFYEADLFDKEALRARLLALVEHVTSPGFLPEYGGPVTGLPRRAKQRPARQRRKRAP